MEAMLAKIKDRQWALADIDWDAPGADTIRPEFRPKRTAFMADLCWIENVGARGFAALARKAPTRLWPRSTGTSTPRRQRHANAEMALMKRWGMLDDGEIPEPNVNIRLAIERLDTFADSMPLSVLGTVITMLEVALDGALLKFLLDSVEDPVCHGLETAIVGTGATEKPQIMPLAEVQRLVGDSGAFERLVTLRLIRVDGTHATLTRPELIDAFTEIRGYGIGPDRLIDLHEQIMPEVDKISDRLVRAGGVDPIPHRVAGQPHPRRLPRTVRRNRAEG